jgi:hypothetical protein
MSTSIFTFDHGQKKLNKAIGVEENYLTDLKNNVLEIIKNSMFTETKQIREDFSPSMLVEECLHNFSYNQLVILASFYLRDKLDDFEKQMEEKMKGLLDILEGVQKVSISEDDVPDNIKDFLIQLAKESNGEPIDGSKLPKEIKDFLDGFANKEENNDNED